MVDELLSRIVNGNYHVEPMMRACKLEGIDQQLVDSLRADAVNVMRGFTPSHVAEKKHVTNWTKPVGEVNQWSLYNVSGDPSDFKSDFNYDTSKKRPVPGMEGVSQFVDTFNIVNLRLNRMLPGAALSPHEEHLVFKRGDSQCYSRARFHIPLFTNENAYMDADWMRFHFEADELYFFNNGCIHAAGNNGDTERVHLVFDMLMTELNFYQMFKAHTVKEIQMTKLEATEYQKSGAMVSKQDFDKRDLVYA